jgi:hypothetical protein
MDADKRKHLIKLLGMLGSAHDGEVLNAAKAAQRLLGAEGLTWEEAFASNNNNGAGANAGAEQYNTGYQTGYRSGYARGLEEGRSHRAGVAHPQSWYAFAKMLRDDYLDDLNDWEAGFVENFVSKHWNNPSPKQRDVFERIADKIGIDCPGA